MNPTFTPGAPCSVGAVMTSARPDAVPDGTPMEWALLAPLFRGELPDWTGTAGAQRDMLIALGWADARGHATETAVDLVDDLARDGVTLELGAAGQDGLRAGLLLVGGTQALLAVDSAPWDWDTDRGLDGDLGGDLGAVAVRVMPLGEVPIQLARWGRVGPAWAEGEAVEVDRTAYASRLRGLAGEAPAGLDNLWSRPWWRWFIRCRQTDTELTYLLVDGLGQFRITLPDTGAVVLTPRPAGLLWGDLQQAYARLPSVRHLVAEDLQAEQDW